MDSYFLAIETSCDESAVAVLRDTDGKPEIINSLISSQIDIHRQYGGVVPEVASRSHSTNLPHLVRALLAESEVGLDEISGFGATGGPGLSSSLLIGHAMAKGFAVSHRKPFYSVNHMEGHLLSPFISENKRDIPPHLALVVSGGHTLLIQVDGVGQYQLIAETIDDAAGEAFDKVARMLGLPYPGGPEIEKRALQGNPKAYDYPRSLPGKLSFSFSGLKTAVLYSLQNAGYSSANRPGEDVIADVCASFQQAVIDSLVKKTLLAMQKTGLDLVTVSGGVSCNESLTSALAQAVEKKGARFLSCERGYSTDNAAMIAYATWFYHRAGLESPLATNINPNLSLA